MYPPAGMQLTVLARIAAEIRARVSAITDEVGDNLWNKNFQGPILTSNPVAHPSYSLEQGPEQVIEYTWPFQDKIVTFYIEFRFNVIMGIDSYDTFRYYLGKLQQRLFGVRGNITLGGLSLDVQETTSNPAIESQVDPSPGGLLTFQVHYRHYSGDPYHLHSEDATYAYGND